MYNESRYPVYAVIVVTLCSCVLCVILTAGLWPFHAPKNDVTWLDKGDGLRFGRYGSILSSSTFQTNSDGSTSGSIELWLAPNQLRGGYSILSFDGSVHSGASFSVRQNRDALVVLPLIEDSRGTSRTAWLQVSGVFREKRPVFVTITLGSRDILVYVDGVFVKGFSIPGPSTTNLTGRLVVANSPSVSDSWSGQILGLAIYHRSLAPAQVTQHYRSWIQNQRPAATEGEGLVALYLFNERAGDTVKNQVGSGTDLIIPAYYFLLHPAFLSPPWREYRANWRYWEDVGINIAGFIPLGFSVFAYLSSVRMIKGAAAITILLGFLTSLTIETLQAILPTRSSGMTDLITNALGTAIGVMSCHWSFTQGLLTKARQGSQKKFFVETSRGFGVASADSTIPCVTCDTNYEVRQP
jgi:hypothetical protein